MQPAKRIKPSPLVLSVMTGTEWQGGSQQEVKWSSQGDVPTVNIVLRTAAGSYIQNLHSSLANTGSHRITVPTGLIPGEYRVHTASCTADKVCAASGIILIDQGRTPPAISNVTAASAEWQGGSQQEVKWSSQGDVPTVKITLRTAAGSYIQLLHSSLANTGSHRITVPTGLIPGEYRVHTASFTADKVCAASGIILIDQGRTPPAISNVTARQLIWHSGSQQEVTRSSSASTAARTSASSAASGPRALDRPWISSATRAAPRSGASELPYH